VDVSQLSEEEKAHLKKYGKLKKTGTVGKLASCIALHESHFISTDALSSSLDWPTLSSLALSSGCQEREEVL
jgi:uncharacterized protein YidB (DUF937 family)